MIILIINLITFTNNLHKEKEEIYSSVNPPVGWADLIDGAARGQPGEVGFVDGSWAPGFICKLGCYTSIDIELSSIYYCMKV